MDGLALRKIQKNEKAAGYESRPRTQKGGATESWRCAKPPAPGDGIDGTKTKHPDRAEDRRTHVKGTPAVLIKKREKKDGE